VVQLFEEKFPELRGDGGITGDLLPAPPFHEFLSKILSLCQLIGIAWIVLGGDKLLRMLPMYKAGRPLPAFYWTIQDNPVPIAIFLFLLAPQIVSKLRPSAAFEVYLDDNLIFSMLKTGGLPTVDKLVNPLVAAGLKMVDTS
jgi:hypothetical protein